MTEALILSIPFPDITNPFLISAAIPEKTAIASVEFPSRINLEFSELTLVLRDELKTYDLALIIEFFRVIWVEVSKFPERKISSPSKAESITDMLLHLPKKAVPEGRVTVVFVLTTLSASRANDAPALSAEISTLQSSKSAPSVLKMTL